MYIKNAKNVCEWEREISGTEENDDDDRDDVDEEKKEKKKSLCLLLASPDSYQPRVYDDEMLSRDSWNFLKSSSSTDECSARLLSLVCVKASWGWKLE